MNNKKNQRLKLQLKSSRNTKNKSNSPNESVNLITSYFQKTKPSTNFSEHNLSINIEIVDEKIGDNSTECIKNQKDSLKRRSPLNTARNTENVKRERNLNFLNSTTDDIKEFLVHKPFPKRNTQVSKIPDKKRFKRIRKNCMCRLEGKLILKTQENNIQEIGILNYKSSENHERIIQAKIKNILSQLPPRNCEIEYYDVTENEITEPYYCSHQTLFKKSTLIENNLENFYVKKLFLPSSSKTGNLLRDWHTIFGRDKTPPRSLENSRTKSNFTEVNVQLEVMETDNLGVHDISNRSVTPELFSEFEDDLNVVPEPVSSAIQRTETSFKNTITIHEVWESQADEVDLTQSSDDVYENDDDINSIECPQLSNSLKISSSLSRQNIAECETDQVDLTQSSDEIHQNEIETCNNYEDQLPQLKPVKNGVNLSKNYDELENNSETHQVNLLKTSNDRDNSEIGLNSSRQYEKCGTNSVNLLENPETDQVNLSQTSTNNRDNHKTESNLSQYEKFENFETNPVDLTQSSNDDSDDAEMKDKQVQNLSKLINTSDKYNESNDTLELPKYFIKYNRKKKKLCETNYFSSSQTNNDDLIVISDDELNYSCSTPYRTIYNTSKKLTPNNFCSSQLNFEATNYETPKSSKIFSKLDNSHFEINSSSHPSTIFDQTQLNNSKNSRNAQTSNPSRINSYTPVELDMYYDDIQYSEPEIMNRTSKNSNQNQNSLQIGDSLDQNVQSRISPTKSTNQTSVTNITPDVTKCQTPLSCANKELIIRTHKITQLNNSKCSENAQASDQPEINSYSPVELDMYYDNIYNEPEVERSEILNQNQNNLLNGDSLDQDLQSSVWDKIISPIKSTKPDVVKYQTPLSCTNKEIVIKTHNITPMPDYDDMNTPDRNRELDKFGLKPLKRKRANQILKYIYEATHPVKKRDVCVISKKSDTQCFKRRTTTFHEEPNTNKTNETNFVPSSNIAIIGDTFSKNDTENDLIFERRQSTKTASCQLPFHIAWHNFVSSNPDIRLQILRYQPISLENVYKEFKSMGFKYHINDIISFLDRRCITIRTNQGNHQNNRRYQKSKSCSDL